MMNLDPKDPLAVAAIRAIHTGDLPLLKRLMAENPDLATARIDSSRTLLHVVTDWPGHFPNGAATVATLVQAGADVNARFMGRHAEAPLHWAASSDDVEVLDALLDAGANIEARGAVIGGGTPMADATAFGQWQAARRLVERGAQTTFFQAATLGLMDRVQGYVNGAAADELNSAFWGACHGGQQACAEYLLGQGADLNWIPDWETKSPLDAAQRSGAEGLVKWLLGQGAKSAQEQINRRPNKGGLKPA